MATLSRTSGKLLQKLQFSSNLTRNVHYFKCNKTYKYVWKTCACVVGGGILFYTANFNHGGVVYALKTKVGILYLDCNVAIYK